MCKFCGLFQNVGETAEQLVPTIHTNCSKQMANVVLDYPHIQWVRPHEGRPKCHHCDNEYDTANSVVSKPVEVADHPWNGVPESGTFDEYAVFWARQGGV